jgi:hypothetical protein
MSTNRGETKMRNLLAIAIGMIVSTAVLAQAGARYECTMGGLVRRVEIVHEPGRAVPCEVQYVKESEAPGQREVLWNAQNEAGYCEARTREFVARLGSLGWACAESSMPSRATEDAAEDDTAVLSAPD